MTSGRVLRLWFGFGGPIERKFYGRPAVMRIAQCLYDGCRE